MVRCRYILRVTLVYVSFSSFWFSFLTRARARAEDTTEEFELRRFLSNAWSCLFERSASFDLNSTEKEVLQHVFSFEGIRARESILSAHPPSPSISLSLSLSRSKGRRAKGQFNFFPQFKFGKLGEKRGKREPKGQSSERFFVFFVLDEFWDDAFVLLCVKWRRRPSKNMSTMWSLALSR